MDEYLASNRALWDEWTPIHERSAFYDVEGFKAGGGSRIRQFERDDLGDVHGKTLLHLQCHFGIDTLSWARLGATVTGADFSPKAIDTAISLADEVGIRASFVCSNVYDLPEALDERFDIVYTSRGALWWLPDLDAWAAVAAHFVKPGGTFYVTDAHPAAMVWDDADEAREFRLAHPYFGRPEPMSFPVEGSYADRDAKVEHPVEYGWPHGLGEIVTAVINAGLRIEVLREFPWCDWAVLPFLEQHEDGSWWLPPDVSGELPMIFALKAHKPE